MKRPCLLLMLCLAGFLHGCGRTVEEEIELGLPAKARHNPLLAAERFTARMGLTPQSLPGLSRMPDASHALVLSSQTLRDRALPAPLLHDWIQNGGHLMLLVNEARPAPEEANETTAPDASEDGGTVTASTLLRRFNVTWADAPQSTNTVEIDAPLAPSVSYRLAIDAGQARFDARKLQAPDPADAYIGGPAAGASILSLGWGHGRVSLLADATWITNTRIGEHDHAALLWDLLESSDRTFNVWYVYANHHSLLGLFLTRFWPLWVSLLAAAAAWLWMSGMRSGPVVATSGASHLDFSRHLAASGSYLWQARLVQELIAPAQQRIRSRAQNLVPTDREQEVWRVLSARSGMDRPTLENALQAVPRDADELVQQTLRLQQLDQSL